MYSMNALKTIRERLKLTQAALGEQLGCTQGNVWHYERTENPQNMPSPVAIRLIAVAKQHGMRLTLDQVYGLEPLSPVEASAVAEGAEPRDTTRS